MANIITISRIFLAFIAMGLLFLNNENAMISLILTIFVMWFDGLDGFVARKFNESSKLGAVLDIMGDRIVEKFDATMNLAIFPCIIVFSPKAVKPCAKAKERSESVTIPLVKTMIGTSGLIQPSAQKLTQ